MSLFPTLFASILAVSVAAGKQSVTVSERGSSVREHKQLVRTEKFDFKAASSLPEPAGSFDSCQPTAEGSNHIPLPNSQDQRGCHEFIVDGHQLAECQCMRREVEGTPVTTPKKEYTCCHKEYTNPGTADWRCYTDCVHPEGNGQNASLVEEKKVEEKKTVVKTSLPEEAGSFQNCRKSGGGNVEVMGNSAHGGRACSSWHDSRFPADTAKRLVECTCERIASLGVDVPQNESGLNDEEFTCCHQNSTDADNQATCMTGCVASS
jgi:hypothetical protein